MAGDWLKIEHATPDKPEVISIAATLDIDQDAALGKLVRIWCWADQQTFDGNAGGNGVSVTKTFIDRYVHVTGFAEAMQVAGWLLVDDTGRITFPRFDRHNGKTSKTRALTAKRVAKCKSKIAPEKGKRNGNASSVTSSSLLYDSLKGSGRMPQSLQNDRFAKSWDAWVKHRSEINHPLKQTMADAQLKMFASKGTAAAVAMIDHTIAMGWQGLREPEAKPAQKQLIDKSDEVASLSEIRKAYGCKEDSK